MGAKYLPLRLVKGDREVLILMNIERGYHLFLEDEDHRLSLAYERESLLSDEQVKEYQAQFFKNDHHFTDPSRKFISEHVR